MSRRYAGGVRRTRPETIPGPGRQTVTIRIVDSCSGQQDLRAGSAPVLWAKRDSPTRLRRPSAPDFFFLVRRQTESTIGRLQKPINKPIILQVPNRDSNFVKMIRPVQGTFSGLQHPPDSDRFTLLIRRFRVRIPGGAPGGLDPEQFVEFGHQMETGSGGDPTVRCAQHHLPLFLAATAPCRCLTALPL